MSRRRREAREGDDGTNDERDDGGDGDGDERSLCGGGVSVSVSVCGGGGMPRSAQAPTPPPPPPLPLRVSRHSLYETEWEPMDSVILTYVVGIQKRKSS